LLFKFIIEVINFTLLISNLLLLIGNKLLRCLQILIKFILHIHKSLELLFKFLNLLLKSFIFFIAYLEIFSLEVDFSFKLFVNIVKVIDFLLEIVNCVIILGFDSVMRFLHFINSLRVIIFKILHLPFPGIIILFFFLKLFLQPFNFSV